MREIGLNRTRRMAGLPTHWGACRLAEAGGV